MATMGRGTAGKRGIGSGKASEKTSNSKPGSLKGFAKTGGNGMGGNVRKNSPGKGKNAKNMGGKY